MSKYNRIAQRQMRILDKIDAIEHAKSVQVKSHVRKHYGGRLDNIGRYYASELTPSMKNKTSAYYSNITGALERVKQDYADGKALQATIFFTKDSLQDVIVATMDSDGEIIYVLNKD